MRFGLVKLKQWNELMSTATSVKQNLGWLWYFIALVVLSVSATVILIVYNEMQQLRSDQVSAARQRWREKGRANYRVVYNVTVNDSRTDKHEDRYVVTVRDGLAISATRNGTTEPAHRLELYGMDKLLAYVADNMEKDQEPGRPRTFTRAFFDSESGALYWYVRRVMGSHERVEINIESME